MDAGYQPLLTDAFLRAQFGSEADAFRNTPEGKALLGRLENWASRGPMTETQAEAGFLKTFFFELWGHWPDGTQGPEAGFTAHPRYPVRGGGSGGHQGVADLALGWFRQPPVADTAQVVCEFKDIRSNLDAPQQRKGNTRSPVKQCADYLRGLDQPLFAAAPIQPRLGIVSDMNEFRLYWRDKMPAQYLRFIIRRPAGATGTALLDDTPEAAFQRFLFARLFRPDMLLSKTGEPAILGLIRDQLVLEKDLERAFYGEYRRYREVLIAALIRSNPTYPKTKGRLVRLAQKLLDRMIFVLFCEDMGQQIAYPPQLLRDRLIRLSSHNLSPDGDDAWEILRRLFRRMDEGGVFDGKQLNRFNGGLFARDTELDDLNLPNSAFFFPGQADNEETLRSPQANLLYFSANYNFGTTSGGKAITLYTLGRIFEQSITELEALEAAQDNRPSLTVITKRKRDGVYYTPEWVVALVVEETVGARLEALRTEAKWDETKIFTSRQIASGARAVIEQIAAIERYQAALRQLTIVDPACGSGAFLIYSLDYLLRETRRVTAEHQGLSGGQTFLFDDAAATKEILSRNIYGVDINPASVELARLALWLHTARGGSALSDLDATIRDGNSLVGPDIANVNSDYALLPPAGRERINAFDWHAAFPAVFAQGGFDCVVGNPPYVKLQNYKRVMPEVADYLKRATAPGLGVSGPRYQSAQTGNTDLFLPFIEKGLSLLRSGGRMGYIAPSLWLLNDYGEGLRRLVHRGRNLDRWEDFKSFQVFEEAITYTALQFFTAGPNEAVRFHDTAGGNHVPNWHDADCAVPYASLPEGEPWTLVTRPEREVLNALAARCDRLDAPLVSAAIFQGLITSADAIYHLRRLGPNLYRNAAGAAVTIEDAIMLPLVSGKDVSRWATPTPVWHILFPYSADAAGRMRLMTTDAIAAFFPLAWVYLDSHQATLRKRENGKFNDNAWHRFGRSQGLDKQDRPKLFVAQTVTELEVAPDPTGAFAADNVRVNCILPANPSDFWYLLAVLHGRVCDWVFRRIAKPKQNDYFEANRQFIAPLPIPRADAATKRALGRRARIARALHTRRARALALIARRLEACGKRTENEEWLLAGQVTPLAALKQQAPASLIGQARTDWAKLRQTGEAAKAMARAAMLFTPQATLAVVFEHGELRLTANGIPVFDHIFMNAGVGPFVALQWRLAIRENTFIGEAGTKTLCSVLRRLRVTENTELRQQAQAVATRVFAYDLAIQRNDTAMQVQLDAAYALTPAEHDIILGS